MVWIERDLKSHLVQSHSHKQGHHQLDQAAQPWMFVGRAYISLGNLNIPALTRGRDLQPKPPNMHRSCLRSLLLSCLFSVLLLFLTFAIPWAHLHLAGMVIPHSTSNLCVPTSLGMLLFPLCPLIYSSNYVFKWERGLQPWNFANWRDKL